MKKNYIHNFIFSNLLFYRLQRHIAFWMTRLACLAFSNTLYNHRVSDTAGKTVNSFLNNLQHMLLALIPFESIYCYIVIYYLAPKYLVTKKYWFFIFSLVIATLASIFLNVCIGYFINDMYKGIPNRLLVLTINMTRLVLIFGAPSVALFFLAIKMFKTWWLKQQEKMMLVKANADAEIQLLKAQVHPHFLFNTLNNIYSFALDKSPKAAELVLQLTEMMKYMITECNVAFVPLEKEIKMIRDYTSLERVRYGNHLYLEVEILGDYTDKLIAPLLMIPFVENAFKHGASKMLENPWVKLQLVIEKDTLHFYLSNNKSLQPNLFKNKNGIGLKNVEKRLKLLYPLEYVLNIESTENSFSVQMQVPLQSDKVVLPNNVVRKTKKSPEQVFSV